MPIIEQLGDGTPVIYDRRGEELTTLAFAMEGSMTDVLIKARAQVTLAGSSHLLEHLLVASACGPFESGQEFHDAVELDHGAAIEATTERETMLIRTTSLNDQVVPLIELIRLQLQENHFTPEEVDKQRSDIVQEIRDERRSADAIVHEVFSQELLKGTPFANTNDYGKIPVIQSLTPRKLRAHLERLKARRRAIVVSGGFHLPDVRAALQQLQLGPEPTRTSLDPSLVNPPSRPIVRRIPHAASSTVQMRLGYRTAKRNHRDALPLYLLTDYLANGYASTLHREIVGERGLSQSLGGIHFTYDDFSGAFRFDLSVNPDKVELAASAIARVLAEVKTTEISHQRMQSLRRYSLTQCLISTSSNDARAEWYAHQALYYPEDIRSVREFYELIDQVQAQDLRRVAEEYLRPERFIGVLAGPVHEDMKLRALTRP